MAVAENGSAYKEGVLYFQKKGVIALYVQSSQFIVRHCEPFCAEQKSKIGPKNFWAFRAYFFLHSSISNHQDVPKL